MTDERISPLWPPARLDGKTAVVTGATSGLGFETACMLAKLGARVVMASRHPERNEAARQKLLARVSGSYAETAVLDLASLDSVRGCADRLTSRFPHLDILVNNAGVMAPPTRQETSDGFELQFGVNHLGHFALTALLRPLLEAAPGGGVVVPVASLAAWKGEIRFDDLQSRHRYVPFVAYRQSKLADLMFGLELARRAAAQGWRIHARCAHPGWAHTAIVANGPGNGTGGLKARILEAGADVAFFLLGQSAAAGAEPLVCAAASAGAADGAYYGPQGAGERRGPPGLAVIPPHALDRQVAARLWAVSERLTETEFR